MFFKNHLSEMKWFEGVVEDRMDPLKLGRVRVRIFGLHTENLALIPEAELHWASVMLPVTSATMNGIGETPALVEGQHVVGFFRDGDQSQDPIIIGSIPGIPIEERVKEKGFYDHRESVDDKPRKPKYVEPNSFEEQEGTPYPKKKYLDEPDTNRLARNEKSKEDTVLISKEKSREKHTSVPSYEGTFSEPPEQYDAKYPYNKVTETESGHVIELDDTPGSERITITHRSGTTIEIHKNGDILVKTIKDEYDLVGGERKSHVMLDDFLTVDKNRNIYVKSNVNMKVDGNVNWMIGGDVNWLVKGNFTAQFGKSVNWKVDGEKTFTITGNSTETTSANMNRMASGNINETAGGALNTMIGSTAKIVSSSTMTLQGSTIQLN